MGMKIGFPVFLKWQLLEITGCCVVLSDCADLKFVYYCSLNNKGLCSAKETMPVWNSDSLRRGRTPESQINLDNADIGPYSHVDKSQRPNATRSLNRGG